MINRHSMGLSWPFCTAKNRPLIGFSLSLPSANHTAPFPNNILLDESCIFANFPTVCLCNFITSLFLRSSLAITIHIVMILRTALLMRLLILTLLGNTAAYTTPVSCCAVHTNGFPLTVFRLPNAQMPAIPSQNRHSRN